MSHIEDRWWKDVPDPTTRSGKRREKKAGFGQGKRYRVRWIGPGGTEESESFPDGQKKAAESFQKEIDISLLAGTYVHHRIGEMLFSEHIDEWLKGRSADPVSRDKVKGSVSKHIVPFFVKKYATVAAACTEAGVKDWLAWLSRRGLELSYQAQLYVMLTSIMEAATRARMVPENPCKSKSITPPRPTQNKLIPWAPDRAHTIWTHLPPRQKIAVPLGVGCGLRIGEISGLSPTDFRRRERVVDIQRQVRWIPGGGLVFSPPKGGKSRVVPVGKSVFDEVDEYMELFEPVVVTLPWRTLDGRPERVELLMVRSSGLAYYQKAFTGAGWDTAFKRAKLTKRLKVDGPHALRHLYASTLLEQGVSINDLAEYLGHHNPSVTLKYYAHMMPSSHHRARGAADVAMRAIQLGRPVDLDEDSDDAE
ncbi:site-specific integrase [Nocardia sp. NPDC051833]|uniref:tyrosine-type recombinase/integrase n=1 Tax=Nocardia sp. NPDC051833 TaxID=3155674 RepID=UPI003424A437